MTQVLIWFFLTLLIGWINLPITFRLFRKLASGGYHLIRPVGLLLWAGLYWLLVSLGLLSNDLEGQIAVLFVLGVINYFVAQKLGFGVLKEMLSHRWKTMLAMEALLLLGFGFWAFVRATNPDIVNTEKFMEIAFVNAILKSPTFPPNDPWLSGYGISYYYFGYLMVAMLSRLSTVASSISYNLTSALWFGLSGLGAYGILFDLLNLRKEDGSRVEPKRWMYLAALAAPLLLLVVSNWYGLFDVLNARGLFWTTNGNGQPVSAFWQWLNLRELTAPPNALSWAPSRGGWSWWAGSRVLQDTTLNGATLEIIDEFPFFTYLLSDIHPHMLSMPFVLLAIAEALNAFVGGWEDTSKLGKWTLPFGWFGPAFAVVSLGGIAFLNTWDFPFYLVLIVAAFCYRRYQQLGYAGQRIKEFFILCAAGGFLSILLYLPFFLSFASQAGGILPSIAFFTPGKNFWVMFGPFLVPLLCLLAMLVWRHRKSLGWRRGLLLTSLLFLGLFAFSWALAWLGGRLPGLQALFLGLQGAASIPALLSGALIARLKAPGTWITLFIIIWASLSLVVKDKKARTEPIASPEEQIHKQAVPFGEHYFVLFLILLGALLTLAPEFVYLRDQFSNRMNTIFKFYFQAWIVWSLAGSYALVTLLRGGKKWLNVDTLFPALIAILGLVLFVITKTSNLGGKAGALSGLPDYLMAGILGVFLAWFLTQLARKNWQRALGVVTLVGIAAGLIYPVLEIWTKTEGFSPATGISLDGKHGFNQTIPTQMAAAEWLAEAPLGVMVEAVSDTGGSYTTYNQISAFSGMPTVLGWIGHESQWRGGYQEMGTRQDDIRKLYSTQDWSKAKAIIDSYNIRYIVVGQMEFSTYVVDEAKFQNNLHLAFQDGNTRIYEVIQP